MSASVGHDMANDESRDAGGRNGRAILDVLFLSSLCPSICFGGFFFFFLGFFLGFFFFPLNLLCFMYLCIIISLICVFTITKQVDLGEWSMA